MNRRSLAVGTILLVGVLTAVAVWMLVRVSTPDAALAPTPTATTTPTPTATPSAPTPTPTADPAPDPKPVMIAVAKRYTNAYQAGRTFGGEVWLSQLRPVASPELVKVVAETDPAIIPTASVETITVKQATADGTGLVRVDFRGDDWLLLHTAPTPIGGLWVVAVEGSKATPTP